MDMDTGDVYLNEKNNTVQVDNVRGFRQILNGIFNCDLGSEPLNSEYGFDLASALRESSVEDSEMFIESLVASALNSNNEKLISKVDHIQAVKENNTMKVTIEVTSVLDDSITFNNILG